MVLKQKLLIWLWLRYSELIKGFIGYQSHSAMKVQLCYGGCEPY